MNRNNSESPSPKYSRSGSVSSLPFGTLAPSLSSTSNGYPAAIFHTQNYAASPPMYLNAPSIKTPQEVQADLVSSPDIGTFYIVTKGREPGIYTDW